MGPGDVLEIKVSIQESDLDKEFVIDKEGYTILERLNRVYIEGLTLKELTKLLDEEYSKLIKFPNVRITLKRYRPVNFYIDGEVSRPGSYTYPFNKGNSISKPTIIDAIKEGGGITHYANLKDVKVTRINSISNGGGKIFTEVDISKVINLSDVTQNIKIYDGDTIFIAKSDQTVARQIGKVMRNNINPETVTVFVGGRVIKPGFIEAPRGIALMKRL